MAQSIGSHIKGAFVGILIALLVLAFAVWGINDVFSPSSKRAVMSLGNSDVSTDEFDRAFRHELRTPLNAIIGFSDMMRSRLFGPLPNKYAEYADLIHDSGQHMLDLIGDVLDMSKVEAGKYELNYSNFDVADVVRSSIKMIRPTADAAEVRMQADIIEDPTELIVEADRKAVRQMLLNLLSNAVKFTPKGGRITVAAKTAGNILNITVEDNGAGMTQDEVSRVGQPYVQTQSGHENDQRGSGLGLSLVKSLCDLHGGRFAISSQKGRGTTTDIYLPLRRKEQV